MPKPKDDLIGALVLKAKEDNGAESENAIKALKRLCEKHDLDFEEIMRGKERVEMRFLEYKRGHKDLARQVVARYGCSQDHQWIREHMYDPIFAFESDQQHYIETLHAYEILAPLYNKE